MLAMVKRSVNDPCPCGSNAKLKHCCGRIHGGRPPSPPELVRARYTAFVLGKVRFIIDTTHPSAPHWNDDRTAWRAELVDYCRRVSFSGLQLHEHELDEARGEAHVTFTVAMELDGRDASFRERSRFLEDGNRWRYVDGELDPSR
ncbi:YchJ family protein [Paraliomyxa miuraensis]|uniref:YchJ family protein n=1 Tax=Paraliomyxa miuraensis TaxID=376150 RepID=UPI00225BE413|nr:YchJ family metal-binding protein [Paraliomyxa miuraensis]MCX4243374.1 YchJ family metal-binding protein [Paraliomyxa miuraensis]